MAREKVPHPVRLSSPTKTRVPMPAARRPGTSTRPSTGPPSPEASMSRNAPMIGDPSRVLIAAKLPGSRHDGPHHRRRVTGGQSHGKHAEPAADGDERGLRAEDDAEGEGGQRSEEDTWELCGGGRAPTGLESLGRLVSRRSREIGDGEAHQHSGHGEQWEWPPHRGAVEAHLVRDRGEAPVLEEPHQLEEPVGHGRHRYAEQGGEHQELDVARRAQEGHRVGGLGGGCRRTRVTCTRVTHRRASRCASDASSRTRTPARWPSQRRGSSRRSTRYCRTVIAVCRPLPPGSRDPMSDAVRRTASHGDIAHAVPIPRPGHSLAVVSAAFPQKE